MKTLFISIWLLTIPFVLLGQRGSCFTQYMVEGKAFFEAEKFQEAWEEFQLARDCPGVTTAQVNEANSWIDASYQKNADLLRSLREKAEYERDSAFVQIEHERDRALALLHASGATQANERQELNDGLNLAFQALKYSPTPQPAFVLQAFGESVYLSHSRYLAKTNSAVLSSAFSRDGAHLLTRSRDSLVRIWTLNNNSEPVRIKHDDYIRSAIFSPNGTQVLTTSNDRTAQLWDLSGNRLSIMQGHQDDVLLAVFAPDGSTVLTASRDHTAKIWDLSGKLVADLKGHLAPTQPTPAVIEDHPVHPGFQRRAPLELAEVAKEADERLLSEVPGQFRIAALAQCDVEDHAGVLVVEVFESLRISRHVAIHESPVALARSR